VALALLPAGVAEATQQEVSVQFSAYAPSQLDVLPGETVLWTNVSLRTHTVTSDTGLFDSGELPTDARFAFPFSSVGAYAYHCTIHPSIRGEIDVRRVILGPLPTAALPVGSRVEFTGRTADPNQPVNLQRSSDGSAFSAISSAAPAPDGTWRLMVNAAETGYYRAASGADVSETRRLLVASRRVQIRKTRQGVRVTVTPSAPYSRILVESYLRERFGWWPVVSTRVDYVSEADIRIRRPAKVRAVLVDTDGWTPLATSPTVVLKK
jgi:plastocyanin